MDGGVVWTFNAGSSYGSPLVYEGRVYMAAGNGMLYCLDANGTGGGTTTQVWAYRPTGPNAAASSPITDGKRVYYSTQHTAGLDASGLHAVWINNGTKAWNASLGGSTVADASPTYWNGSVYCSGGSSWNGGSHDLYRFNATNGNLTWTFTAGDDICGTAAIDYGRVYFGSLDGKVYCVDAEGSGNTTTKHWEYDTQSTYGIFGSPAVAYGRVFIGSTNGRVYSLGAHESGGTTTVYWNKLISSPATNPFSGPWGVWASPAITPDYVYVGTGDNAIFCQNRTSGDTEWTDEYSGETYGFSSPAVYKDKIIGTSDNGILYVLGPDIIPPKINFTDPVDNEIDVDPFDNITVKFDETNLDGSTITTSTLVLKDSQNTEIPGAITTAVDNSKTVAYFSPNSPLNKEETYTFQITTGISDTWFNTLDGDGDGVAEGVGVDEYEISFTTLPFYPPVISSFFIQKLTEDVPHSVNLTTVINDLDTPKNELVLAEDSDYAEMKGFEMHFLYPEGVTSDLINFSVSDGIFTIYRDIDIQIEPVNDPPVISNIPPLELTEDITYTLNMANYITDIDSPLSIYTLYNTENSQYVEIDGLFVNLTYPNGITSDIVNISIVEIDYTLYAEISLTVDPVNDPPYILSLPDVTVDEDIPYFFDMEEYLKDIDTPLETLTLEVNSQYAKVTGQGLQLTYPDGIFTDTIEVKVYDGELYGNTTLKIIVEPINDPPQVIRVISPKEGDKYDYGEPIELKADVHDDDLPYGDILTFYWEDSESGYIAYTQNATDITLDSGDHIITFTVQDDEGSSDSMAVSITIRPQEIPDTDGDNIKDDIDEDDDGDGIPDTWELKYPSYLDPLDPTDATEDPDEDGYSNLEEYLGIDGKEGGDDSSDPTKKSSIPKEDVSDTGSGKESSSDSTILIVVILIVIVIVVLLVVFMLQRKKKAALEKAPDKEEQPQPIIPQPEQTQMVMPVQQPYGTMPMPPDQTQMPPQELMQPYQQDPYQMQYQDMTQQYPMQPGQEQYQDQSQMYPGQEQMGPDQTQMDAGYEESWQSLDQPQGGTPLLPEGQAAEGETQLETTELEQQPQVDGTDNQNLQADDDSDQDPLQKVVALLN
jgi:outer membrane protein assembly factor BamB